MVNQSEPDHGQRSDVRGQHELDLFQHEPTKTYYLRNNDTWLKTADVKGAWSAACTLPESFKKLPAKTTGWT